MRWLLAFIPISIALRYGLHVSPLWAFLASILAIVPLADEVRRATDVVAKRCGSAVGGLLNVSFGNAPELILALFVVHAGQASVAKAQITGSLIGNSLLGLGLAATFGGIGREQQKFSKEKAGVLASLLVLTVFALLVPAVFDYGERANRNAARTNLLDEQLSIGVSIVLIAIYVANLVYTLYTHRDAFAFTGNKPEPEPEPPGPVQPVWQAIAILLGATLLVALEAEMVSGGLAAASKQLGITEFFMGITVLAVVGNAAEYISAIYFARKDRMGLAVAITVGSTIQVALLVAPILVIASYFMGTPMNLVFRSPLELVSIAAAAFAVNAIVRDGATTWFEGVMLLGVYLILAIAFFFVTAG